jgi:hypothetical protein
LYFYRTWNKATAHFTYDHTNQTTTTKHTRKHMKPTPTPLRAICENGEQDTAALFARFRQSNAGAYPTCRCLPGLYDQANRQEWAERGTIDGEQVTIYYLFDNAEAEVEDGSSIPFDADHISRIEFDD